MIEVLPAASAAAGAERDEKAAMVGRRFSWVVRCVESQPSGSQGFGGRRMMYVAMRRQLVPQSLLGGGPGG